MCLIGEHIFEQREEIQYIIFLLERKDHYVHTLLRSSMRKNIKEWAEE